MHDDDFEPIPECVIEELIEALKPTIAERTITDFLSFASTLPEFGPHDIAAIMRRYAEIYTAETAKLPLCLIRPPIEELH